MTFNEFLKLCIVTRNLYGREASRNFFEKNIGKYYNLGDFAVKLSTIH